MNDVDCVIIGAGVIGLAVARAIARMRRDTIIIECESRFGLHTSSRNSEVIHAGIHYPQGSLKARLCLAGRDALYRYCDVRGIAHRRCGKLTVAASAAELHSLQRIEWQALAAGVNDLKWLTAGEAQRLEPELRCHAALESPSSGIIDSHGYMQCLLGEAESSGATAVFSTRVTSMRVTASGVEICIDAATEPVVRARHVVNCAGLNARQVAESICGFPREHIPMMYFGKGSYFSLPGRSPFSRLIYPAPPAEGGHLGIHMTLDLSGSARFGPDLEWVDEPDYTVNPDRAAIFAAAARAYFPKLPAQALLPAYAGVRPRISGPGQPARDFLVSGPSEHGIPGVINLFGFESPGLTASLAVGELVASQLESA